MPKQGHSVFTVVASEGALNDCNFKGCKVMEGGQGLIASVGNGSAPPFAC